MPDPLRPGMPPSKAKLKVPEGNTRPGFIRLNRMIDRVISPLERSARGVRRISRADCQPDDKSRGAA